MAATIIIITDAAYKLLAWFSPAMPIGAYSYSHGLEYGVEAGLVSDAATLRDYVETALRHGTGQLDASLLCKAYRASLEGTCEGRSLADVAILAAALRGTSELALESAAQGRALLTMLRQAWGGQPLDALAALCTLHAIEPAHGVVAGVACATHGLPLQPCVVAFLHGFAANLISAGVRLVPLGQTEGERLTAALEEIIETVAADALVASLDDLGSASPMIDLCAIAHETQYTRLVPLMTESRHGPLRVGIGGPVGWGKTALVDALCKQLRDRYEIAVITNNIYTLVNTLAGTAIATQEARADDTGRHTTTGRALHRLPAGGWLLDTPGMRELQLADAKDGLDALFADIVGLARSCRFADCRHESEPGCAVQAAIAAGRLDPERLHRQRKLAAEEARNSESLAERLARDRAFGRMAKVMMRDKRRRQEP